MATIVHNPSQYFSSTQELFVVRGQAGVFEEVLPPTMTPEGYGCFGMSSAGYLCAGRNPNRIAVTDDFTSFQVTESVLYEEYNYLAVPRYAFQGHDGVYAVARSGYYKAADGRIFTPAEAYESRIAYCNGLYIKPVSEYDHPYGTVQLSVDASAWVVVGLATGFHQTTFKIGSGLGLVADGAAGYRGAVWVVTPGGVASKVADLPGGVQAFVPFYSHVDEDHTYILASVDPPWYPQGSPMQLYRADGAGYTLLHTLGAGFRFATVSSYAQAFYVDGFLYVALLDADSVPWIYEIDPITGAFNPVLQVTAFLDEVAIMVLPGGEVPVQLFWTNFNLTYEIP